MLINKSTLEDKSRSFKEYLKRKQVKIITSSWKRGFQKSNFINGADFKTSFHEVYRKYRELHLPTISESSQSTKLKRCNKFLNELFEIKMLNFTPHLISEFINFKKETYVTGASIKYNHDKQLKDLSSILNFWSDQFDFRFVNPIRKHHYKLGIICPIKDKNRQISIQEFQAFLHHLKSFYQDLAKLQWFMAGRIGEVAGIQKSRIDLENRTLTVKEVLVWIDGVPQVKDCPKNGESRSIYINDSMKEIIKRQLANSSDECLFLFQKNGKALRYNLINENYNKAWKASGLIHKFSGTHIIRYCAAIHARKISGSLDAARAVTGHKSIKMAEKYACFQDNDLNKVTLQKMASAF